MIKLLLSLPSHYFSISCIRLQSRHAAPDLHLFYLKNVNDDARVLDRGLLNVGKGSSCVFRHNLVLGIQDVAVVVRQWIRFHPVVDVFLVHIQREIFPRFLLPADLTKPSAFSFLGPGTFWARI